MGLIPFALIYGASAKSQGLTLMETVLMSLTVFAGSSQLVFVNLWQTGINLAALSFTVVLVNLRLFIYGSSIRPFLSVDQNILIRILRSYILTDESYAISLSSFLKGNNRYHRTFFYIGAGFPTWIGWQIMGVAGYLAGTFLPQSVPLKMAIPLVFLSLLLSILKSSAKNKGDLSAKLAAVLASGLFALLLKELPHNLGLICAIFIGVAVGALMAKLGGKKARREGLDD
jgi:predicted branched-subunit amino acid permease